MVTQAKNRKKPTQKDRVLAFLKERGERGATSIEILTATNCLRYSARIMDLRVEGHDIRGEREGTSEGGAEIWRYRYVPPVEFSECLFGEAA